MLVAVVYDFAVVVAVAGSTCCCWLWNRSYNTGHDCCQSVVDGVPTWIDFSGESELAKACQKIRMSHDVNTYVLYCTGLLPELQYVGLVTVHRRCAVIRLCAGVRCHFRVLFVCLYLLSHFYKFPSAICVEGYLRGRHPLRS